MNENIQCYEFNVNGDIFIGTTERNDFFAVEVFLEIFEEKYRPKYEAEIVGQFRSVIRTHLHKERYPEYYV